MIGHARHRTGRVAAFEQQLVLTKSSPANDILFQPTVQTGIAYGADVQGRSGFVLNPGLFEITLTGTQTVAYANPNQAPRAIGPMLICFTGGANAPVAGRRVVYNGSVSGPGDEDAGLLVPQGTSEIRNGTFQGGAPPGLENSPDRFNLLFGPVGAFDDQFNQATLQLRVGAGTTVAFQLVYDLTPGGLDISYQVTAGTYTLTVNRLA